MTYDFRVDWNGDGDFDDTGENVTARVYGTRETVTISYGRDQARSLSPTGPGEASFGLNNRSRDYSPENPSSPLAGNILPARQVRIQKTHLAQTYTLFRGYTDDYELLPERPASSVRITCLDLLARFKDTKISTPLYAGITTGQAIGYILDEMGWPTDDRDIDNGATLIRFWWETETDAFEALEKVVNSEGIPAMATVDADGNFMFRDRHHRLTRSASLTSQTTFRDTGAEPKYSAPLAYDHGWRDIVNSVTLSVDERRLGPLSTVWETDASYSIDAGETISISVEATDPFGSAEVPEEDTDFTVRSGSVAVSLSRTSGSSLTIFVQAGVTTAVINGMRLRARPLSVASTFQVHAEDSTSIQRYGRRSPPSLDAPWVGIHDAKAIAEIMLAHRAERLPIVTFRVVNGNDTRMTQMLSRDLSDRVTVVEAETGLNADFYIEHIGHTITQAGLFHETTFGCEKAPTQPSSVFRFDTAGQGFNDGRFGITGLSDPDTMFRFDQEGQGFDDAVFAY